MFPYIFAFCLCLCVQLTKGVSDNIEVITSCWLITLQDNQKFKTFDHVVDSVAKRYSQSDKDKIVHDIRVYMIKKCFATLPLADSKQIIKDFEAGQSFHVAYREVVKGFDYTHYIKDLKNKDLIPNPQLDDTISSIVKTLESEFLKETQSEIQQAVPPIGVFGMNFNYLLVFPIIGGVFLAYFAINAFRTLQTTPKKKK
ncbi:unnamed protein product (macronuclear) [Paramecium tetraurelia]|uniref:Uncharacterized protein n=1 Tax=Paramecium tetraurelia TaxID=5888 RepID=A0D940_PARTE|nr:uncharacterized protein GSPATT00014503001 [Paramecium tetraurelia]CAK79557.1 unnamed protein product [Paramecium tetraurelia]|eukprot:XP_001446954.1 hypothetical protein (macronuclear) [Paramecium tetraurelia strain d4-2]